MIIIATRGAYHRDVKVVSAWDPCEECIVFKDGPCSDYYTQLVSKWDTDTVPSTIGTEVYIRYTVSLSGTVRPKNWRTDPNTVPNIENIVYKD